jgi:hypothetical protein
MVCRLSGGAHRVGFRRASRVCGANMLDAMCTLAIERGHRHWRGFCK